MKTLRLKNLIYASSSSVYGSSNKFPFKESQSLNPLNFYGQTKLINEKIANIYQKNFNIKTIGLRFFTIYGPLGRPDMFIPKIISRLKKKQTLELYNKGNHFRDFTYVEDVAKIIKEIVKDINKKKLFNIYNICNGKSYNIRKIIKQIEKITNLKLKYRNKPFQIGDMFKTYGSNKRLISNYKIDKFTSFEKGIIQTLKTDL